VFKVYFKIMRAMLPSVLIYVAIFVVFGVISAKSNAEDDVFSFEAESLKVCVVDEDDTYLSRSFTDYLSECETLTELSADTEKALNDAVRFGLADAVVIIPEGYSFIAADVSSSDSSDVSADGDSLTDSGDVSVDNDSLTDSSKVSGDDDSSTDSNINIRYITDNDGTEYILTYKARLWLNSVQLLIRTGSSEEVAVTETARVLSDAADVNVTLLSGDTAAGRSYFCGFFSFIGYSLICMLCVLAGLIMAELREPEVSKRIELGGIPFVRRNIELSLAFITMGLVALAPFLLLAVATGRGEDFSKFGWFTVNVLCLDAMSLGLAFLISSLTRNDGVINMVTNMLALSMSFLCGVFVPRAYLTDGVLRLAKLLPLYWYVDAVEYIDSTNVADILSIHFVKCEIILLVFAAVLFIAGLVVLRIKRQKVN